MDYQAVLEKICRDIQPYAGEGKVVDYIPELAAVNPDQFGISLLLMDGRNFEIGDAHTRFSVQSISKVFALSIALSLEGEEIWKRMGKEPSGSTFNSLVQLEYEHGIPRNPFVNAGALVMVDILLSHLQEPEKFFIDFVRKLSDSPAVDYNRKVADSEMSTCYLNAAIVNLLKYHHNINNDIADVLRFYTLMCSVEMSCSELARAFMCFARSSEPFRHGEVELTKSLVKRINAIMQTCGFYDEAGEFSFLVGLPGKSGVGGGIAAIYPSRYSIAVWSPRLNAKGNSILGMKALEYFTTETSESIF